MSAQVTKQHLKLIDEIRVGDRSMRFDITDAHAAQLIADSEAKAVAEWQDFVHLKGEAIDSLLLECDRLRAEVERLKRDYDYDHKCLHEVRERCELWKQRAERADAELAKAKAIIACIEEDGTEEHNAAVSLRQELATERAKVRMLHSALHNLADEQNGAPLERRREGWQEAMDEAIAALAATEEKL